MPRAFLIVMDSVGCGGAPDAASFGDAGSNTLGHIAAACAGGQAEVGRSGLLRMPHLDGLGLGAAIRLASGAATPGNPGSTGFGQLNQGSLEGSNVELVTELITLIQAQRAYEINSRAIKAGDQMLQTSTDIVR